MPVREGILTLPAEILSMTVDSLYPDRLTLKPSAYVVESSESVIDCITRLKEDRSLAEYVKCLTLHPSFFIEEDFDLSLKFTSSWLGAPSLPNCRTLEIHQEPYQCVVGINDIFYLALRCPQLTQLHLRGILCCDWDYYAKELNMWTHISELKYRTPKVSAALTSLTLADFYFPVASGYDVQGPEASHYRPFFDCCMPWVHTLHITARQIHRTDLFPSKPWPQLKKLIWEQHGYDEQCWDNLHLDVLFPELEELECPLFALYCRSGPGPDSGPFSKLRNLKVPIVAGERSSLSNPTQRLAGMFSRATFPSLQDLTVVCSTWDRTYLKWEEGRLEKACAVREVTFHLISKL